MKTDINRDLKLSIGARIQQQRLLCRYSREDLAEYVDISVQFLADIESGKKGMSLETFRKICKALGVSSDYLLFGIEENEEFKRDIEKIINGISPEYYGIAEDILRLLVRTTLIAEKKQNE